jgi:hypothetical protein
LFLGLGAEDEGASSKRKEGVMKKILTQEEGNAGRVGENDDPEDTVDCSVDDREILTVIDSSEVVKESTAEAKKLALAKSAEATRRQKEVEKGPKKVIEEEEKKHLLVEKTRWKWKKSTVIELPKKGSWKSNNLRRRLKGRS